MNKPLLIAHRGDTVNFPENTIQSFKSAFERSADGVELDIQLVDGKIIVVHNYLAFDKPKEYPSLQSVLEMYAKKGRIEIEVKSFSTEIIEPLVKLLSAYESANFEITTSVLPLAHFLSDAFPDTSIGVIFSKDHFQDWMSEEFIEREITELMGLMKADVAHISGLPIEKLTKSLVEALHFRNIKVHYHINRIPIKEQVVLYRRLEKIGVDQCTFDDIGLIEKLVK